MGDQPRRAAAPEQPAELGRKPVPGLYETVALIPSGMKAGTVRFQLDLPAPGRPPRRGVRPRAAAGNRSGPSYIFGEPIATKKGKTALPLTHNIRDASVRLVAVDREGKEHPAEIRSNSGVWGLPSARG